MKGSYYTDFEGIVNNLERRFRETNSAWMREEITTWMNSVECPVCHGNRLNDTVLAVTVGGLNISEFCRLSVVGALDFLDHLEFTPREQMISELVIKEIRERLGFLRSVGLEYLTLCLLYTSPSPRD